MPAKKTKRAAQTKSKAKGILGVELPSSVKSRLMEVITAEINGRPGFRPNLKTNEFEKTSSAGFDKGVGHEKALIPPDYKVENEYKTKIGDIEIAMTSAAIQKIKAV